MVMVVVGFVCLFVLGMLHGSRLFTDSKQALLAGYDCEDVCDLCPLSKAEF